MFPPPNFIYHKISLYLRLISSKFGVDLIRLYGMTAFREGNVIDLGFTQLQVVDACNGLRYLIPLIVLALLLAYLYKAPLWKRAILIFSAVPLSIGTNSLRIAITGILYQAVGPEVAEGFFHGFSGWFIFMFSFGILLGEMWILRQIGKEDGDRKEPKDEPLKVSSYPEKPPKGYRWKESFKPQSIVVLFILLITLGLSHGVEFREKIPSQKPLDQFPTSLDNWTGEQKAMELRFVESLDLSDYVIIDYGNDSGKIVNLYVAYYESQRKGESIHSPSTCLPGGGWVFNEAGLITLPMPGHQKGAIQVRRAHMQKSASRQLVYYWFPQRGRILTNAYQLKIFAFWDALTKQRTDGALVRLITPVGEYEKLEDADARLQAFVRTILPVLDEFLPGKTIL
jgi:exosortase D (VPLPA-CTERM-specific)